MLKKTFKKLSDLLDKYPNLVSINVDSEENIEVVYRTIVFFFFIKKETIIFADCDDLVKWCEYRWDWGITNLKIK